MNNTKTFFKIPHKYNVMFQTNRQILPSFTQTLHTFQDFRCNYRLFHENTYEYSFSASSSHSSATGPDR